MPIAYASAVIDAPVIDVWDVVRDFNDLPSWYPGVARSRIEDGLRSDQVGAIRDFTLDDGTRVRERLLELSDSSTTFVYRIELSPFDVENYVARLHLHPITDTNATFAEWSVAFDCTPDQASHYVHHFGVNVFLLGLKALQTRWAPVHQ